MSTGLIAVGKYIYHSDKMSQHIRSPYFDDDDYLAKFVCNIQKISHPRREPKNLGPLSVVSRNPAHCGVQARYCDTALQFDYLTEGLSFIFHAGWNYWSSSTLVRDKSPGFGYKNASGSTTACGPMGNDRMYGVPCCR